MAGLDKSKWTENSICHSLIFCSGKLWAHPAGWPVWGQVPDEKSLVISFPSFRYIYPAEGNIPLNRKLITKNLRGKGVEFKTEESKDDVLIIECWPICYPLADLKHSAQ